MPRILDKHELTAAGLKCEILHAQMEFVGVYYCAYVYLPRALNEDELEYARYNAPSEITFESAEKVGIDTNHIHNIKDGTNNDFEFAKKEITKLAEFVRDLLEKGMCEMTKEQISQEYQNADNEQRAARENRAENQNTREARKARAEQVLCNVLAANYARQISTPIYSLLKSAVMDFVRLKNLFSKIGVQDFIICNNNGKRQLWFYKGEPSAAYNASIETLWKIKIPFISVETHGFVANPLVHYYNGETITDTKDISDEFVELVEQFKAALKGGEK